jgi:hypothetical protein
VSPVSPARLVKVESIRFVTEAWPRRYLDDERVDEFTALFREQGHTALPPPELVEDGSGGFLIADGVHRWQAALNGGVTEILASVHSPEPGVDPVAFAYRRGLECSAISSKPLTRAEKRTAIRRLLREQPEWSDRELGRLVGVDHKTVGRVRKQLEVPNLLGDGEPGAFRPGPSPETLAKKLFQAFEKIYEARGLGVLDFFTGDRTGERLAGVLTDVYGDRALERAQTFSGWLGQAVDALDAGEVG